MEMGSRNSRRGPAPPSGTRCAGGSRPGFSLPEAPRAPCSATRLRSDRLSHRSPGGRREPASAGIFFPEVHRLGQNPQYCPGIRSSTCCRGLGPSRGQSSTNPALSSWKPTPVLLGQHRARPFLLYPRSSASSVIDSEPRAAPALCSPWRRDAQCTAVSRV